MSFKDSLQINELWEQAFEMDREEFCRKHKESSHYHIKLVSPLNIRQNKISLLHPARINIRVTLVELK